MSWWPWGKNKSSKFVTYDLPGEVGTIALPATWQVDLEDDASTLVAWPPDSDVITLRVSSLSFAAPNQDESVAKNIVRKRALDEGHDFREDGGKGIASYRRESDANGDPLELQFWEVGSKNTLVIISATIFQAALDTAIVRETLAAIPEVVRQTHITKLHQIIESGDDRVSATLESVEPHPQKIVPFGPRERKWLEGNEAASDEMSRKYGSGGSADPGELDRIFARWMQEDDAKESDELVANALGAAFGNFLVENHGFRWVVVTDEYGAEFAVRHEVGETTVFPRAAIEKRIERQEPEVFHGIHLVLMDQHRKLQNDG